MRRYYWWIVARDENNKPYLIAGANDENDARHKALEMLGNLNFKLVRLPTTNLARASSMIKGMRLEHEHNLHSASERLGHNKSLAQRQRRLSQRGR